MSEHSSPKPRIKRRSWVQFGTRTLFVLMVLVAVAAWWIRGAMLAEKRREELMLAFQQPANFLLSDSRVGIPWHRKWAAWLQGVLPGRDIVFARINYVKDAADLRELLQLFPDAEYQLSINAEHATPETLACL